MSYRVWHVQNPPTASTFYEVESPELGAVKIGVLMAADLKDPNVWGNAFGLETDEGGHDLGGEWVEWYDEQGNDVTVAFEGIIDVAFREAFMVVEPCLTSEEPE